MNENINQEIETFDIGMDNSVDRAKNAKATSRRLLKYLAKQKFKLLAVLITVLVSSALNLVAPLVMGQVIDQLTKGIKESLTTGIKFIVDFNTIGRTVILLLVIYILTSLFIYFGQYLISGVAQTLTLGLRKELSQKLNRLPLRYYDCHKKGDILSRATSDLERVADSLQQGMMQLISSSVTIVAAIVIMLSIHPLLALITVFTLALSMFITTKIAHRVEGHFADNQKYLGELNSTIEEAFTGQVVIKAFSGEAKSVKAFQKVNGQLCDANRKAQFTAFSIEPLIRFIGKIGYVIVAVVGGIFAVQGTMTLGNVQAFIQYIDMCSEPMTQISYILNMLQSAVASAERVFELLDEEEEVPDLQNSKQLKNPRGEIAFEHVRFGYLKDKVLMEDINIHFNSGDTIAIVGSTGAGKTTLVNLMMRFYEIQGGRITIDNVNIKEFSRGTLRKMFGMVLQDTWIFQGSIKDNIAYSRPDASLDEVILAAKAARADHFIRTLPQGYQTILNEDGSNVSQGQKQLLTIARAILANPSILILDEATSSVDTRTEAEIQKAMNQLMQGRTSFVIAHRLSTIRDADLILVMQNGTIIEKGKHQELLNQKGLYEKLYNSQFASKVVKDK
ncbi:ABC transporter transmembrane region [Ruminiclostridium papyrosolvens DSM 2782]|uniref:ABC transporter transmembrane region n=1 Tax=Ruminiclostridium papyrosolvens DSM 2782 TaxID=588581 RepID=F1TA85_9FIRM|nr:ABC transporter ATP-binding protein [Ruminiclostridium papyrosolvens]EGD48827.1 ABC transporter transmembrane region [Ruminiclostridium papyrosolvens DSM 2782]WES32420.1 ABC transporter ATP-binding protein [Ruminiclostridium papyrosolvens DSM 2782]